jgi:hypothetical protein
VVASHLEPPSGQLSLFGETGERTRRTMNTIDTIRRKFGNDAIGRASQVKPVKHVDRNKPLERGKEHNSG